MGSDSHLLLLGVGSLPHHWVDPPCMVDFNVRAWLLKALWLSQCKALEVISRSCSAHVEVQVFARIAGAQADGFRAGMSAGHRTSHLLGAASFSRFWRAAFGVTPSCAADAFSASSSMSASWLGMAGVLSASRLLSTILDWRSVADLEPNLPIV